MFRLMIESVLSGASASALLDLWEADELDTTLRKVTADETKVAKTKAKLAQMVQKKKAALDVAQQASQMGEER